MENILVSACLLGVSCRYDGASVPCEEVIALRSEYNLIPVCAEIMGGLPTPRVPAEIIGGKVINRDGADVTDNYVRGAENVLHLAKLFGAKRAILKERSPSCGYGRIYDGTFSGALTDGSGVTAALLAANGIEIIGESALLSLKRK